MLNVILQSFVLQRTTLPTVILLNVVAPRANHLQSFPGNAVLSFKIRNNKIRVLNFIKHFFSSPFTINRNKLACSSMKIIFTQEPTLVKYLTVPLWMGTLLSLPTNIRLGKKYYPGANTLAYFVVSLLSNKKVF
jgi:hypothetical protein